MLKLHLRKSNGVQLSKRQNEQTIPKRESSKDYSKLRHYFLICLFLLSYSLISQNSQNPFNCERDSTSYTMSMPHPDCEIERPSICLKIKFHDINNTNDPDDHFTDDFWRDLLLDVNEIYKLGNIEWVFEDNCIHRTKIVGLGTDI